MEHPVVVHVYDLSQGMARQLSASLLGFEIPHLPHTGIFVFGFEFFFGGGIQRERPERVTANTGLTPVERLTLGTTRVDEAAVLAFLESPTMRARFSAERYDLFTNNCAARGGARRARAAGRARAAARSSLTAPAPLCPQVTIFLTSSRASSSAGAAFPTRSSRCRSAWPRRRWARS